MQRGFVNITNSTLQRNTANRHGGALYLGTWTGDKDATQNMKDVTSYYNCSNSSRVVTSFNCSNSSRDSNRSALLVANPTIADNEAQSNGGKFASGMLLFGCTAAMHPPCEVLIAPVFAHLPALLCAPSKWLHAAARC